ncbi:MAG: hypothetical protein H0W43_14905 [Chthoniobacterales bacterium]|nr:hypothetical protein [Chthoniobacterales bacterium]
MRNTIALSAKVGTRVLAVSSTTHNNAGFQTSAAGSNFVNLNVAGIPIIVTPEPNTTIDLLGFGRVVLNEQITTVKSRALRREKSQAANQPGDSSAANHAARPGTILPDRQTGGKNTFPNALPAQKLNGRK